MKLLITGGKGMLGRTLQQEFNDCEIVIADLPEADITDDEHSLKNELIVVPII